MNLHEALTVTLELATRATARHLPKRIAYWSFAETCHKHTRPNENAGNLPYTTILTRFYDPPYRPDRKPHDVPTGTITWKAHP